MAYNKSYKKGGCGGKLGRSNMSTYNDHKVVKIHTKKFLRLESKEIVSSEVDKEYSCVNRQPKIRKKKKREKKSTTFVSVMTEKRVQSIISKYSGSRLKYFYSRDDYASCILYNFLRNSEGVKISQLKKSLYSKLLSKPEIKEILARCSDGVLKKEMLISTSLPDECYVVTLASWGADSLSDYSNYYQTSRRGKNLVVQLNFTKSHDREYERFIKPGDYNPFSYDSHPVQMGKRNTLAWARIDLSDDNRYALIEEIQNDWIREALWYKKDAEETEEGVVMHKTDHIHKDDEATARAYELYFKEALSKHMKIWDEAMLSAAIWFLKEKIGVEKFFYHTFEGGKFMKNFDADSPLPPKSIYTKLPERFCFKKTEEFPPFLKERISELQNENRNSGELMFYVM